MSNPHGETPDDENLLSKEMSSKRARLLEAIEANVYMPHLKQLENVPGLTLNQTHRGDISVLYSAMLGRNRPYPVLGQDADAQGGVKRKRDALSPSERNETQYTIGRPWDRGELYMRLQTFKSMTWFAKPTSIGAVECARRGWENTGTDELTCETCRAVLAFPRNVELEVMSAVVASFEKKLETAHDQMCPWRSSVCSMSLLEFPTTLPDMTMLADFESRAAALKKLICLPPIAKEAVEAVVASGDNRAGVGRVLKAGVAGGGVAASRAGAGRLARRKTDETIERDRLIARLSSATNFDREDMLSRATFLALCGWSLRLLTSSSSVPSTSTSGCSIKPAEAALQCTMCGTRVGLWSFFGDGKLPGGERAGSAFGFPGNQLPSTSKSSSHSIVVNNQVAMNMRTTIAGGLLYSGAFGEAVSGPFGGPEAAAGAFSMGCSGSTTAHTGLLPRSSTATANTSATTTATTRFLASYKASCRSPVDPLDAHRAFCPWAANNSKDSDTNSKPGWQVYLDCLNR